MDLTPLQRDALTELINIGYGKAAGSLSTLTGQRVRLEVPTVSLHESSAVAALLKSFVQGNATSVSQGFSGAISGQGVLLFEEKSAFLLAQLITDEHEPYTGSIGSDAREVITEVGNVILNAVIGVFGNLLEVQVTFAVPRLQVKEVEQALRSVVASSEGWSYALMVHTRFQLRSAGISGYMAIVLGLSSLDRLLARLDDWSKTPSS